MIDFDSLVLGPAMDAFACPAILTPVVSQPSEAAYLIRGVFHLKPSDIVDPDTGNVRADNYAFGVRASEFPVLVARGDLLSEIAHPSFQRFLAGFVFVIEDVGDDGMGGQTWIIKKQSVEDDEP